MSQKSNKFLHGFHLWTEYVIYYFFRVISSCLATSSPSSLLSSCTLSCSTNSYNRYSAVQYSTLKYNTLSRRDRTADTGKLFLLGLYDIHWESPEAQVCDRVEFKPRGLFEYITLTEQSSFSIFEPPPPKETFYIWKYGYYASVILGAQCISYCSISLLL